MLLKTVIVLAFLAAAISTGLLDINVSANGQTWTTQRPAQAPAALR